MPAEGIHLTSLREALTLPGLPPGARQCLIRNEEAGRLGADGYIVKPFAAGQVRAQLARLAPQDEAPASVRQRLGIAPFIATTICCLLGGVISDWLVKHHGHYVGRSLYGAFTLVVGGVFLILGARAQDPVAAALLLIGLVVAWDSWRLRARWGADGPESGLAAVSRLRARSR